MSKNNRVGPVIVSHPIARACLESAGTVFSFRQSDRTTGETHYRYERTGCKQGDVTISQVSEHTEPTPEALNPYVILSGFSDVDEWRDAIQEVHGDLSAGYVYRIKMLD